MRAARRGGRTRRLVADPKRVYPTPEAVWMVASFADLLMALGKGEGAKEYFAEGRAAAEISRIWAAIERSIKAIRGSASSAGAMHKQAA